MQWIAGGEVDFLACSGSREQRLIDEWFEAFAALDLEVPEGAEAKVICRWWLLRQGSQAE